MIVAKAPCRISFAGGGSDLPSYYVRSPGAVLSTTIDKYTRVSIRALASSSDISLAYPEEERERVASASSIRHPIFRAVCSELLPQGGVEIVSTSDVPNGTGLASSSSFTVALLAAIRAYRSETVSREELAAEACHVEITRLGNPIGKQDQYAAAFGGLNFIEFASDHTVRVTPLALPASVARTLEQSLLLFYVGNTRRSGDILSDQEKAVASDDAKFQTVTRMVGLAHQQREALLSHDLGAFARVMDEGWRLKRSLSSKITNAAIDGYYTRALQHGALGGKLLGAGGGGFLLVYCELEHQERLRRALSDLPEMPFGFISSGAQLVSAEDFETAAGTKDARRAYP
ncbi:sugar kinase [Polyangium sp. 6x1]|uniref:GHMP family kinase ATP-binding protein n=1 Tax=Polyangium sp. 6x1 TaxID=3042689 RepID=UPI002482160B|nr:sugar kinase [Polyangium sp. 6x1]MDI1443028.1 sugar kinase [Polyangium sp. 6x1]